MSYLTSKRDIFQGSVSLVLLPFFVVLATILLRLSSNLVRPFLSPLRVLPGPKGSFFQGNLKDKLKFDHGVWYEQMFQTYGSVFTYKEAMGARALFTTDFRAINHILGDETIYHRRPLTRGIWDTVFNQGLIGVNGPTHKRQRRILNPCFSSGHIRDMTEIIEGVSQKLQDVLKSKLSAEDNHTNAGVQVNLADYLSRATLDVIGLAGFNYSFNALDDEFESSEFYSSLKNLIHIASDIRFSPGGFVVKLLKIFIPLPPVILKFIPLDSQSQELENAAQNMIRILYRVLEEGKRNLGLDEKMTPTSELSAGYKERIGDSKDILSVILRANVTTLADGARGLSDTELAHQIATFLLAGHDTTANALSWTLASLATYPEIQNRLRNELLSIRADNYTAESLNSLLYLDSVIRESLRFHSIASFLERVASQDDIVPVDTPYKDRYGHERSYIGISKGDTLIVPILTVNHSKSIWGEDAAEFKWISPPETSHSIPGTWGNQLSFGGGSHGCIGFKLAIHDHSFQVIYMFTNLPFRMKIILFTLVKNFVFEMVVPMEDFDKSTHIGLNKPALKSDPLLKVQLPMIIRLAPTENST